MWEHSKSMLLEQMHILALYLLQIVTWSMILCRMLSRVSWERLPTLVQCADSSNEGTLQTLPIATASIEHKLAARNSKSLMGGLMVCLTPHCRLMTRSNGCHFQADLAPADVVKLVGRISR